MEPQRRTPAANFHGRTDIMDDRKSTPFDAEIKKLDHDIEGLREKRDELSKKRAAFLTPFYPGDILVNSKNHRRARFLAAQEHYGRVEWRVETILKNGSIGKRFIIKWIWTEQWTLEQNSHG